MQAQKDLLNLQRKVGELQQSPVSTKAQERRVQAAQWAAYGEG